MSYTECIQNITLLRSRRLILNDLCWLTGASLQCLGLENCAVERPGTTCLETEQTTNQSQLS